MDGVDIWAGRAASTLRLALRMTNEGFAERLGTSVRTVANWNSQADLVPIPDLQRALDTLLSQASDEERARFFRMLQPEPTITIRPVAPNIPPSVRDSLRWLEAVLDWPEDEAWKRVVAIMGELNEETFQSRRYHRSGVSRSAVANALRAHYALQSDSRHGFYAARISGENCSTSILTEPSWLNLRHRISPTTSNLEFDPRAPRIATPLDEGASLAAITRLAETLAFGTRLANAPTYRLANANVAQTHLSGELGVIDFIEYALTLDLLENELLDAIGTGRGTPGDLPLRRRYLPDSTALVDIENRVCVGGPVTLTAIARNRRGRHDYVLLAQERSGNVLNAARRLAVIPKAFHQPLIDVDEDANLAMTIEREMEEELFGRPEVDLDGSAQRLADPMRSDRLSEPMRWLADRRADATWHIECTGFGINAVSGNFEFPCLLVIDDDQWWDLYGGHIEANWEVEGLRRYSTLSTGMLESLIADPSWSNEGLFSFIEGLRRLAELNSERVALPNIEVELEK